MSTQQEFSAFSEKIKPIQILSFAIPMGAVIFTAIVVFLYFTQEAVTPEENQLLMIMSFAHIAVAFSGYMGAFIFTKIRFNDNYLKSLFESKGAIENYLAAYLQVRVVKLALMEGPVLFGLVVCFLAIQGGQLQANPIYWANLASLGILLVYSVLTFPTLDRLVVDFNHKQEIVEMTV